MRMEIDQRFIIVTVIVLAGLLILHVYAYQERPQPRGHYVFLADDPKAAIDCGDSNNIFLRLQADGTAYINSERKLNSTELVGGTYDALHDRCYRVAFLMADDNVPYQDVMNVVSQLQSRIPFVNVVLTNRNQLRPCGPRIRQLTALAMNPACK